MGETRPVRDFGIGIILSMFASTGIGLSIGIMISPHEYVAYALLAISAFLAVLSTRIVNRYEVRVEPKS